MTEQLLQSAEEALRALTDGLPLITEGHLSTNLLVGGDGGLPPLPFRLELDVPEHADPAAAAAFVLSLCNVPGAGGTSARILGLDVDPSTKKFDVTLAWPAAEPLIQGTLSLGSVAFG